MADAKLTFQHGVEIPKRRRFETLLRSLIRNTHVTWLWWFEASGCVTSVSRRGIPADSAFDWQGREQITQLHICLNPTPTKYKSGVNASSLRGFLWEERDFAHTSVCGRVRAALWCLCKRWKATESRTRSKAEASISAGCVRALRSLGHGCVQEVKNDINYCSFSHTKPLVSCLRPSMCSYDGELFNLDFSVHVLFPSYRDSDLYLPLYDWQTRTVWPKKHQNWIYWRKKDTYILDALGVSW